MLAGAPQARADLIGFDDPNWVLNGNTAGLPAVTGAGLASNLQLTTPNNGIASSAFNGVQQDVTKFTASFTYTNGSGAGAADGAAFVIQNAAAGSNALGGGGGGLGFAGIQNSAALEFNIYAPNVPGTALNVNGATGGYVSANPVNFSSTNAINITLAYNGTFLTEYLSQGTNSYTRSFLAASNGLLGLLGTTGTAFVGFTGATGGANGEQDITNFHYIAGAATNGGGIYDSRANGDYNTASTWNLNGVPAATIPTTNDAAVVHGGNAVTIAANGGALQLYVGGSSDPLLGASFSGSGSLSQTGGTLTVAGQTMIGGDAVGVYSLSAGTLASAGITVGQNSNGSLTVSGGTVSSGGGLVLGDANTASGALSITSGSVSTPGRAIVGRNGIGTITVSGGSFTSGGGMALANGAAGAGTVTVSAGSFTSGTDNGSNNILYVGDNGIGVFNLSGGTATTFADLVVGNNGGSTGTFNQTGGTLQIGSNANKKWGFVGNNGGVGTYNLNGGTVNDFARFYVGRNNGSQAVMNMSSGTFNGGAEFDIGVGGGATGVFNQSGGTLNITHNGANAWNIVGQSGGNGTYNMTGGSATFADRTEVGRDAGTVGVLNVSGNAVYKTNDIFQLGGGGGNGSVTLAGSASITSVGDTNIGADNASSVGIMTQTGGTFTQGAPGHDTWFNIGRGGSTGTYNMSAGSFKSGGNNWIVVGRDGGSVGTFNLSGTSIVSIPNGAFLLNQGGAQGTVNQSGGSVTTSWLQIGDGGTAPSRYNMSGGFLTTVNEINLGRNGTPDNIMTVSGGTITVSTAVNNDFNVGRGATGELDWSGGTINALRGFLVGPGEGGRPGSGTVNITNTSGATVLNAGQRVFIGGDAGGNASTGVMNVFDAVLPITAQTMQIGLNAGSSGTLNVNGTSVVTLSGSLIVGAAAGATGVMNLNDNSTFTAGGLLGGIGTITNAGTGAASLAHLNLGSVGLNPNNPVVFSGLISDGGAGSNQIAVTVLGGLQVFATDQTYTGGTTINAGGILSLGANGTSGSVVTPNILDSGTLAITRSDNYVFTQQVTGVGGVTIAGSGNISFPSNYNYSGVTQVGTGNTNFTSTLVLSNGTSTNNIPNSSGIQVQNNGNLDVTGLSGGGINLVNQGLGGGGTVTGNVVMNGGSLVPGNFPAIGTLHFANNLTVNGSATTTFVLGTPGASTSAVGIGSLVVVNGNLTLSNGLNFNPLSNGGANGQGSLGQGFYELFAYNGTLTGFDPTNTFISPINANYSFSNFAGVTGGVIDVYVSAPKVFAWTGAVNNVWDVNTTLNWANPNPLAPSVFLNQLAVGFGDTNPITGTTITNSNISIVAGGVSPLSLAFTNNNVNYTFSNAGGGTAGIAGTAGIVKSGTGSVTFNSPNTLSGAVAINNGVIALGANGALGTSAGITIANGATLQLQPGTTSITLPAVTSLVFGGTGAGGVGAINSVSGSNTVNGSAMLTGDTTIQVQADRLNFNQPITAASPVTLTKIGAGRLTLSGNNTFGNSVVNGGILRLNTGGSPGTLLPGSTVTVNVGGLLQLNNGDTLGFTNGTNATGSIATLNINPGGSVTTNSGFRTTLENTLTINMVGGTLTSGAGNGDGNHNYTDRALINATSDALGNPSVISATRVGIGNAVTTLNVTRGPATPVNDLVITSDLVDGFVSGGLNLTGNGVTQFTGAGTFSGTTTISAGSTLKLGDGVTKSGSLTSPIVDNGTLIFANPTNINQPGAISGTGGINKTAAGTLTVSGNNTYAGPTLIQGGTLHIAVGSFAASQPGLYEGLIANGTSAFDTTNPIPNTTVQLTTRYANQTAAQGNPATTNIYPDFPDNSTWGYKGLLNISASNAGTATFGEFFDDSVLLKVDGVTILNDQSWNTQTTGTATLAAGTHTLELRLGQGGGGVGPSNTNGENGVDNTGLGVSISLNGGPEMALTDPGDGSLLQTGGGSAGIPANSPVIMSSNTGLDVSDLPISIGSLADAPGATGQTVQLGYGGNLTIGSLNTSTVFSGTITDTLATVTNVGQVVLGGKITKVGVGTLTLAGNNPYGGGTFINGGTLQVGNGSSTGSIGTGPVANNAALVINRTGALAIPGNISGTGSLSHIGPGVTTLGGNNGGYSGPIAISAGTLVAASGNALGSGGVTMTGVSTLGFQPGPAAPVLAVSGFGGSGTGWTVNSAGIGGTPITADVLTLTDGNNGESRSAWYNTPQGVGSFTSTFTYQAPSGSNPFADGTTFTVQNSSGGVGALGGGGGSLGYAGITNSVAIELNVYPNSGAGGGVGSVVGIGGTQPSYNNLGPINLASGDPIAVTVTYPGGNTITESFVDLTTSATASLTFYLGATVPSLVGGTNAIIGFTGATGGLNAVQTVSNFSYTASPGTLNSVSYANNIAINGTNSLDAPAGLSVNLTGVVGGTGSLNKTGAGTISLTSATPVSLSGLTGSGGTLNFGPVTRLANSGPMSVASGATVNFVTSGSVTNRLTHTSSSLAIAGAGAGMGTVDLGNHELLLTSSNTTGAALHSYLANAYDPNGNADWGQPGLTSSVAKGNPVTYSVGYAVGSDQSAIDAGVTLHNGVPLGPNQRVVRAVLTGDANMDGTVDFFDITQILGYKYNTNQAASYTDGDLDYSGKVDFFDIVLLLSANYNTGKTYGPAAAGGAAAAASAAAAGTLTGSGHSASTASSAIAQSTTVGTPGDGKPDFAYNPATGHLTFMTDGGTFTTTGGSASFVSSLTISSASGELIGAGASSAFAGGTGATLTSTLLSSALTNSPGFTDGFDIGAVLPTGLTISQLTADLTVKYQSLNGGSLKTSDILVPEPTGLALLGLGAAGLLARRRRNRSAK
jgi:autotransporter-associated beta strand protein